MHDDELDQILRFTGRSFKEERQPCPSPAELIAYHDGIIGTDEKHGIRLHIAACGICDLALTRIRDAEKIPIGSPWVAAARSFRLPAFSARPGPLFAYVGYALAAVLLVPAYLGIAGRRPAIREVVRELPVPSRPGPDFSVISPQGLSLDDRSAVRGRGEVAAPAPLAGNPPFFLLRFWIPRKGSKDFRYEADITDAAKRYVATREVLNGCDASDVCVMVCDHRSFPPGKYDLEVREIAPPGVTAAGPFRFSFEL